MLRPNGSGVDKSSQPVEAVEDNTPEYKFLDGRSEEHDDQDYRRYGHARTLLYPAHQSFHERLLDRRSRRVPEPFEDEDAERGHDHTEEECSDADGHPGADSRQEPSPGPRESKGRQRVSYLLAQAPHPKYGQPEPPHHGPCCARAHHNERE